MNKLQETIKALIKKLCSNKGWYEILTLASDSEMPWRLVLSQPDGRYHIIGVLVLSSMTFFKLKKYELKEVPENHVLESVKDTPFLLLDLSRDLNPRSVIMDSFKVEPSIFDSKYIVQDAKRLNRVYESLYDIRDRIKLLNNFGRVVLTRNHPSAVIRKSDLWEALNFRESELIHLRVIVKVPNMNCDVLFVSDLLSEVFMYNYRHVWKKRPLVVFRKIVLPQFMEETYPSEVFCKLNGELYEFQGQYECFKTNLFGDTFWRLSSDSVSIELGCEGRLRLIP